MRLRLIIAAVGLVLCATAAAAASFSQCYQKACAIITVPDRVVAGAEFEVTVEGYLEGASSWDVTAYRIFANAPWSYDARHMLATAAQNIDAAGLNWGGSVKNRYLLKREAGVHNLTFAFGSRSRAHGYYDVVAEAQVVVTPPAVPVAFDIKPQSCPNPLNTGKEGVLSAAIVGSETLDVTQIDPASVTLAGVAPIHFAIEDVTAPYYPLQGKLNETDCTTDGADGYPDLTLKFRAADVQQALALLLKRPLVNRETVVAEMRGAMADAQGMPVTIVGEDVLRILAK